VRASSVNIHTRSLIDSHWYRYDGDVDTFREAFRAWARARRCWESSGVTFLRLWATRRGQSCSWFDSLAAGDCADSWWTDPRADEPRPKLSDVLAGRACPPSWTRGPEIDCEVGEREAARYREIMLRRAPHEWRRLLDDARAVVARGRAAGVDDDVIAAHLSTDWQPAREQRGLLSLLIDEAIEVAS